MADLTAPLFPPPPEPLATGQVLCTAEALVNGGRGVRFRVIWQGLPWEAFAIRYQGKVYAYLNRCAHRSVELDWAPGEFFDTAKTALVCATHGARYDPASGDCVGGPCYGERLIRLSVQEKAGNIHLVGNESGASSASPLTGSKGKDND